MKFHFLLIVVLSTILIACKKNQITYHENGLKHEVFNTDDQKLKHGIFQKYNLEGNLYEEAHYTHGKLDGSRILYHSNGVIDIKEYYVKDKLEGEYQKFDDAGQLVFEATYTNNILGGIAKSYFPDASLKEEVTFENNEENGPFTEYHPNGNIHWKGNYNNGDNEIGVLEEYNIEGILIKKMDCNGKGVCNTIWTLENGDTPEKKKDA